MVRNDAAVANDTSCAMQPVIHASHSQHITAQICFHEAPSRHSSTSAAACPHTGQAMQNQSGTAASSAAAPAAAAAAATSPAAPAARPLTASPPCMEYRNSPHAHTALPQHKHLKPRAAKPGMPACELAWRARGCRTGGT